MKTTYRYTYGTIRILRVLLFFSIIILSAVPSWNMLNKNVLASPGFMEITLDTEKEEVKELVDPVNTFDYEGTDYLRKNAVEEINVLVGDYFDAWLKLDMDTMESLVSDIDGVNFEKMQAMLEYIESIDNIICYSVAGDLEGTYRVYVYYDMKIRGIDTPAPALTALYVTMSSDGNYIVYLSELDSEMMEFIEEADESEDVIILKALVNERLQSVAESDQKLKEFYDLIAEKTATAESKINSEKENAGDSTDNESVDTDDADTSDSVTTDTDNSNADTTTDTDDTTVTDEAQDESDASAVSDSAITTE